MSYRFASEFPQSVASLFHRFGHSTLETALQSLCDRQVPGVEMHRSVGPGKGTLVVRTANHPWEVLAESSIERLFPDRRHPYLFFMPKGYPWSGGFSGDTGVEVIETPNALMKRIHELAPETVFLQVGPHTKTEFIAGLVAALFPEIRLIVEFYDMSCFFSDSIQSDVRGYSPADIEDSWTGIAAALTLSSDIIVKAGGKRWLPFAETASARCHTFYPMLDNEILLKRGENAQNNWKPADNRRVLFGGAVTASELEFGPKRTPGANFLRYFEAIGSDGHLTLEIYNAADRNGRQSEFAALIDWCSKFQGRVHYRSAINQLDLLACHADTDFGFFCVHYPEDPVEHVGSMAVPNRMMTHVCGGIPTIVDDRAEYMAKLVTQFGAGLVIDPVEMSNLPVLLRKADVVSLRDGVAEMKSWMLTQNRKCLDKLDASLKKSPILHP